MPSIINGRNIYNKIFETNIAKKLLPNNPTDTAALLALISTTTKDAVNCYYYTTQSLHNKKIPEEKRKFVAGLDLSNGILNVVIQFTLGTLINNYSPKLFESWFGKAFEKDSAARIYKSMKKSTETIERMFTGKPLKPGADKPKLRFTIDEVIRGLKENKKWAEAGFKVMAVLIVTQVIAKRVIVPFLSTPMAGFFKEQLEKREKLHPKKEVEEKDIKTKEENDDDDDDEDDKVEETSKVQETPKPENAQTSEQNIFTSFDQLAAKEVKYSKDKTAV